MGPHILKVTGLNGETEHYLNLNLIDRIDIKKLPNCAAHRLYAHASHSDLDIAISYTEAQKVKEYLEAWT